MSRSAPQTKPWPAVSIAEARALLTAPGSRFEMEEMRIRGARTRVWKHAPPTLRDVFLAGMAHGERVFLVYEEERASYRAFARAALALADALIEAGVRKGDRVAIAMRNLPEWPAAFFGDAERFERIVEHLPNCPDLERVYVCRDEEEIAHPKVTKLEDILGRTGDWELLPDRSPPEVLLDPDDDATIFYTSGTTGHPKGALGTHRNSTSAIVAGAYSLAQACVRRGEPPPQPGAQTRSYLLVVPFFHATGCQAIMIPALFQGAKIVLMHRWDAETAMRLIERERCTHAGGVPTVAWQLIEHPARSKYDLSSLQAVAYGGAPAASELVRRIKQAFPHSSPGFGWGMTETSATFTTHQAEDYLNRPESCGPAVPVCDMRIVGSAGETLPPGEVGELWAKGPNVVRGYWNKPEATAQTFVDGWLKTGDLAKLDEEGFCYIVDRKKDMLIRGGENIYSIEVEEALYSHPAVMDAALVAIPHRTLGEEPGAVVTLKPGARATEAELREFVAARLAAFKVPVKVAFWPEPLPRNANGKILKGELKRLFQA